MRGRVLSKSNEAQIVGDVKAEMQNWMLEQQLANMENTLSDTISFFSTNICYCWYSSCDYTCFCWMVVE